MKEFNMGFLINPPHIPRVPIQDVLWEIAKERVRFTQKALYY
jgi:hypothetical protein